MYITEYHENFREDLINFMTAFNPKFILEDYLKESSKLFLVFHNDKIVSSIGMIDNGFSVARILDFYYFDEYELNKDILYIAMINYIKSRAYKLVITKVLEKEEFFLSKGFSIFKKEAGDNWYKKSLS